MALTMDVTGWFSTKARTYLDGSLVCPRRSSAVGDGTIHSKATGHPIEVVVRDGFVADSDVVVFLTDGYGTTSVVDEWCPHVNFHPNHTPARNVAGGTGVPGKAVHVNEGGRSGRFQVECRNQPRL